MRLSNKTYTITEYGGFTRNISFTGYQSLPAKTFDALETFVLANNSDTATEAIELLFLSARRGIGKTITARNYVGIITMIDGTVIEILPKISGYKISEEETKKIFIEMLKTLHDVTFKDFNVSTLRTDKLNLLEIFIKMFLLEVSVLTKQGLKAAYSNVESNERFYKGKLLTSQNIKSNLINRERFYVSYDDFSYNRSENRLIKTTLRFLLKQTSDTRNHQDASRLLTFFENVDFSENYEDDFSKCIGDRSMNHYNKALSWCRVFLRGNSFTAFVGSEVAIALLFPMEKIFESFIAAKVRKHVGSGISIKTQNKEYSLFDNPAKSFTLKPDIVLRSSGRTLILDTKWKLLSDKARNYGISQSDMYQMYAYSKKYKADSIILIYPLSDSVDSDQIRFSSDDSVTVEVSFVDLRNVDNSIAHLLSL